MRANSCLLYEALNATSCQGVSVGFSLLAPFPALFFFFSEELVEKWS
jgi:hypothetical protein